MGFVFGSFDDIGFGKGDKHIEGHWHLSVRENLRQGTSLKLLVFGGCKFYVNSVFFNPDIVYVKHIVFRSKRERRGAGS